jgi:AcrR family transcriptional regulator
MDIALTLFARHGIARISLNAIAKEAGVTPAMLHYYSARGKRWWKS